jgi:hypothetical protein
VNLLIIFSERMAYNFMQKRETEAGKGIRR